MELPKAKLHYERQTQHGSERSHGRSGIIGFIIVTALGWIITMIMIARRMQLGITPLWGLDSILQIIGVSAVIVAVVWAFLDRISATHAHRIPALVLIANTLVLATQLYLILTGRLSPFRG